MAPIIVISVKSMAYYQLHKRDEEIQFNVVLFWAPFCSNILYIEKWLELLKKTFITRFLLEVTH